MFIAALLTITKRWKQPRCPLTDEGIDKHVVSAHSGILFSLKKEVLTQTLAVAWMTLEDVILSEISQT